jgi:protoporphyrinogen oxidase
LSLDFLGKHSKFSRKRAPNFSFAEFFLLSYRMKTLSFSIDHVIKALEKMKIIIRDNVVYSSVMRQKFAYVIYDLKYQRNIATGKEYYAANGIGLVGRFAEFEYLNMHECIRNAINFVEKL